MGKLEEARAFFNKDRYAMVTTGIEIDEVGEHYAKCSLKIDERHKNALGKVMGGVCYTMADFVFAVATNFCQPPTVTVVSQISYLNEVKGNCLYAVAELVKDGRTSCFYTIHITDNLGTQVASVATNGMHLAARVEK